MNRSGPCGERMLFVHRLSVATATVDCHATTTNKKKKHHTLW